MDKNKIVDQLRQFGVREDQIPSVLADVAYHLQEFGVAQIFGMPDGTLKVGATSPDAGAPLSGTDCKEEAFEEHPSDVMRRDLALYADILSVSEHTTEALRDKLERMKQALEVKLGEDVEDYISHTQLETHKASGDRAKAELHAWQEAVHGGNTMLSFQDWKDSSLPV